MTGNNIVRMAIRAGRQLRRRLWRWLRGAMPDARRGVQTKASHLSLLIGLGLIVLTITIAGVAMGELRQQTEAAYRRQITTLGTVLAEQTARYISAIDLVLRDVAPHIATLGVHTPEQYRQWLQSAEAHEYLTAHLQNLAQVDSFDGIDANGRVLASTRHVPLGGVDVTDRGYFRALAAAATDGLYISTPVTGRIDHAPLIVVARRINAPDGTFLGLILGAINVDDLVAFYSAINTQPGQSITLLRHDGRILVRDPDPTHEMGGRMPSDSPWYGLAAGRGGFYRSPGYLGGQRALVSVHPVDRYKLIVDVSVKEDVALAGWWHQVAMLAMAGLAAALGFGLLAWTITTLFRRQEQQNVALRQTADALRDSEARAAQESRLLHMTLEAMDQGLMMISRDRTVPICNRRAMELLDLPPELMTRCPTWEEVLAHQWQLDEFARADATFQDYIRRTLLLEGPLIYDRERPNGRVLEVRTTPLADGEAVRTYTDITQRKQAERRIEFLAYHDNLTGLANRTLLSDRLSQAVEYAKRGEGSLAVLSLDVDRFKVVNDTYGHDAGDRLLHEIGDRLRRVVRAADTIARVGGDEFIILQTGTAQPASAAELAQRIEAAAAQPVELAGHQVVISLSIGIALYPADGDTVAALLKAADVALYRAKADGRGLIRLFEPEMDRVLTERRLIERDLQVAIGTNRLALHFQPQFACGTGMVTGFEALVRWRHDVRGDIPPSMFIPVAEESRLIFDLSAWVLETACVTAASWPVPHRISVNLSPAQFRDDNLPAEVAAVLRRTGLSPERLELEVTESVLIRHTDQALDTLRALKRMGVRISLDDFGTGYSSLSYLRSFPFDKIKIDKSFVQALGTDPNALPIVQAILAMGRSLNLDVIAEGVETELHLWLLRGQQCAQVQGFLLGLPIPAAEVLRHLHPDGAAWPRERSMTQAERA